MITGISIDDLNQLIENNLQESINGFPDINDELKVRIINLTLSISSDFLKIITSYNLKNISFDEREIKIFDSIDQFSIVLNELLNRIPKDGQGNLRTITLVGLSYDNLFSIAGKEVVELGLLNDKLIFDYGQNKVLEGLQKSLF